MTKKLPKFDKIGGIHSSAGTYRLNRVQGQSLNDLKVFVDSAIALYGGESVFSMSSGGDGYPGYIGLELEEDILAERAEADEADKRNKTRLEAWNALTPKQRKELGPITMHDGPGPLTN